MTPNEYKNTIGVTKTIQMVGEALGLVYHPDCSTSHECCKNNELTESEKYIVFWYNPDCGFRLKVSKAVFHVENVEMEAIIDFVSSFKRFNKALLASNMVQDIAKDFK